MARSRTRVFFDGGCRPNPGRIEVAVVVAGVTHLFDDLGHGTNTDAEWMALIRAAELARSLGLRDVELVGDALGIIREANSILREGHARPGHSSSFLGATLRAPPARVRWVRRAQNLAGIALAARHPR